VAVGRNCRFLTRGEECKDSKPIDLKAKQFPFVSNLDNVFVYIIS